MFWNWLSTMKTFLLLMILIQKHDPLIYTQVCTTNTWTFGYHWLEMTHWLFKKKEICVILTLWSLFKETLSLDMFPKIYVTSFGNFYLCLTHQYVLKYRCVKIGYEISICSVSQGNVKWVESINKKIAKWEKKFQARFKKCMKTAV